MTTTQSRGVSRVPGESRCCRGPRRVAVCSVARSLPCWCDPVGPRPPSSRSARRAGWRRSFSSSGGDPVQAGVCPDLAPDATDVVRILRRSRRRRENKIRGSTGARRIRRATSTARVNSGTTSTRWEPAVLGRPWTTSSLSIRINVPRRRTVDGRASKSRSSHRSARISPIRAPVPSSMSTNSAIRLVRGRPGAPGTPRSCSAAAARSLLTPSRVSDRTGLPGPRTEPTSRTGLAYGAAGRWTSRFSWPVRCGVGTSRRRR